MVQGIGVRCGAHGVRVLGVEREGDDLRVTAIAAGPSVSEIHEFVAANVGGFADVRVAYGLGPGDFLTACMRREDGLDDIVVREQLLWEIERKVLTDIKDYSADYSLIGDVGFVFAGRKKLISFLDSTQSAPVFTDVEPVAMLNGCEAAGEFDNDIVLLVSIEAEGISSVVMEKGLPQAMDSFPVDADDYTPVLAGQDHEALAALHIDADDRLAQDICGSVERITSFGKNKGNPAPERIVVTGTGAYIESVRSLLADKYGVPVKISDPFSVFSNDSGDISPELSGLSAAYTSCLGLALRAMETD